MSRTLHIYRDSALSKRHITIKDSDKMTPLYFVSTHTGLSGHANLEIFVPSHSPTPDSSSSSTSRGTKIAEIDFHSFSSRISISLHGTPLELLSKGLFSRSYIFESGTGLGQLMWKFERFTRGMNLVDGQGRTLARFQGKHMAARKEGVLEVMVGNGDGHGHGERAKGVDEVVVSAMAMMELERRRRSAAAAGGGGGA